MSENEIQFEIPDDNQKIWRYMEFSKYVDLLTTSELHFARGDTFQDPFECSFALFQDESARRAFASNADIKEECKEFHIFCKLFVYVSCWHINDEQSAALWELYSKNKYETIAIQTTFRKFKSEVEGKKPGECIRMAMVKYDSENAGKPIPNNSSGRIIRDEERIIYKRKSFEHEKELRAFIYKGMEQIESSILEQIKRLKTQQSEGKRIKITLSNLIEKVYVSPLAKDSFVELVKTVSGDLRDRVLKSNLYELY